MPPTRLIDASPTEAEAWQALLLYEADLEEYKIPGALRNGMLEVLSKTWKRANISIPLDQFAQLWKDQHYRSVVSKMIATGPGAATFEAGTYRRMKSSRLDGYWDVILENFAAWIESFAKEHKSLVTLEDSQSLTACLDEDGDSHAMYEEKLNGLFWDEAEPDKPLSRSSEFLLQLPDTAYTTAYEVLLINPPKPEYDLENILNEIFLRSADCKPLMLHVCFWFNPDLMEPANRAEHKDPLFYHLKPAFSKFKPSHPSYEDDETWKPEAVALQSIVIDFILEHWESSKFEDRYCRDPHQYDPKNSYGARFKNASWYELVLLVRNNTSVPFRHPDLLPFNSKDKGQLPSLKRPTPAEVSHEDSKLMEQVSNVISAEYGDDSSSQSAESRRHGGRRRLPLRRAPSSPSSSTTQSTQEYDSALEEVPQETSRRSTKRKASVLKQEGKDGGATYNGDLSPSERSTKIIKFKMPSQWVSVNGSGTTAFATSVNDLQKPTSAPQQLPVTKDVNVTRVIRSEVQEPSPSIAVVSRAVSAAAESPVTVEELIASEHPVTNQALTEMQRMAIAAESLATGSVSPKLASRPVRQPTMPPDRPFRILPPPSELAAYEASGSMPNLSYPRSANGARASPVGISPRSARTKTAQAVTLLEEEYSEKLQINEMLAAINMVKNEVDAEIFVTLSAGKLRDAWLMQSIAQR